MVLCGAGALVSQALSALNIGESSPAAAQRGASSTAEATSDATPPSSPLKVRLSTDSGVAPGRSALTFPCIDHYLYCTQLQYTHSTCTPPNPPFLVLIPLVHRLSLLPSVTYGPLLLANSVAGVLVLISL